MQAWQALPPGGRAGKPGKPSKPAGQQAGKLAQLAIAKGYFSEKPPREDARTFWELSPFLFRTLVEISGLSKE